MGSLMVIRAYVNNKRFSVNEFKPCMTPTNDLISYVATKCSRVRQLETVSIVEVHASWPRHYSQVSKEKKKIHSSKLHLYLNVKSLTITNTTFMNNAHIFLNQWALNEKCEMLIFVTCMNFGFLLVSLAWFISNAHTSLKVKSSYVLMLILSMVRIRNTRLNE